MTDLDDAIARLRGAALSIEHRKPGCPCGPSCSSPIACLIQMESAARRLRNESRHRPAPAVASRR